MKFAVVLSGCGVYDGSEIHEAVLTLLSIDRNGGSYQVFAPNVMQHHVINHLTGEVMVEPRNVLLESARIARGNIKPLAEYKAADFDALIFPGGFGAAKNLSSYAFDGPGMRIDKVVERVILETHAAGKPLGALCIAPVILAKILDKVELTVGTDPKTISDIKTMGGIHSNTGHGEVVVDKKNKIVTSPCYMLDASISDIADGADATVKAIMSLTRENL
jgi:enhancing lycopene biosynthesis protein 2